MWRHPVTGKEQEISLVSENPVIKELCNYI